MFKKTLALIIALMMVLGTVGGLAEDTLPETVLNDIPATETAVTFDEKVTETDGTAIGVQVANGTPDETGVTITGEIEMLQEGSYGLVVYDNINNLVYFIGNIQTACTDINGIAVYLNDGAEVYITGNVYGNAERSFGIQTENSTAEVTGGVFGGQRGIDMEGASSSVTVSGNVETGTNGAAIYVIGTEEGATGDDVNRVNVLGTIVAGGNSSAGIVSAENGKVYVEGNVQTTGENEAGVYTIGGSQVYLKGDITMSIVGSPEDEATKGNNNGIYASGDGTTVMQRGDITVNSVTSSGIYAEDGASVAVNGDVLTNATDDAGIQVTGEAATVYVLGKVVSTNPAEEEEKKEEENEKKVMLPAPLTVKDPVVEEETTGVSGISVHDTESGTLGDAAEITVEDGVYAKGDYSIAANIYDGGNAIINADLYANDSQYQTGAKVVDSTAVINGDINANGSNAYGLDSVNSTVTVNGDIYGGMRGINLEGESSDVIVNGEVSTGDDGAAIVVDNSEEGVTESVQNTVLVNGGIKIGGKGSAGVAAWNEGIIQVSADIKMTGADEAGVYATAGSSVTLIGDTTIKERKSEGIKANGEGAFVSQTGDITIMHSGSTGIYVTNDAQVVLDGNIYTDESDTGVEVYESGEVRVDGDIVALDGSNAIDLGKVQHKGDAEVIVTGEIAVGANSAAVDGSERSLKNANVYVYGITLGDETASLTNSDDTDELFLDNVNYIIKDLDKHVTLVSGYEESPDDDDLTYTNQELDDGKLTVTVASGYRINLDADSRITKEDGKYVLTLNRDGTEYGYIQFEVYNLICVGETEKVGSAKWKVVKNEDGIYTLVSVDAFTADQLADKEALLHTLMSDAKFGHIKSIADTPDQEYIDKFFSGEDGHLQITVDAFAF